MVIKWKKRNASAVVVYVLAVSFLLLGLTGFLQQEVYSGMEGPVAEMSSRDYQSTAEFRNFISSRFHSFLNMAIMSAEMITTVITETVTFLTHTLPMRS